MISMGSLFSRLMTLLVGLGGAGLTGYFVYQSYQALQALPPIAKPAPAEEEAEHAQASAAEGHGAGHGAKAEGHGAAKSGHGEDPHAKKEAGHGESGHGAAKEASADAGHGGGHGGGGEHGGGGHGGGADRAPASTPTAAEMAAQLRTWVSIDPLFVNILDSRGDVHEFSFQLELELFDEAQRSKFQSRSGQVKSAIIETARHQKFESLNTLPGKLAFKEVLATEINQALLDAVVRDIHIYSIYVK